ncbi:MAG: hypothetical protein ACXWRE_05730 [Pseudobdellovibrionaceae bacterium]
MFSLALLKIVALFHFPVAMGVSDEQFYRIKIPATSQSCEQEATRLAARFQKISGKVPVDSKCSGHSKIVDGKLEKQLYILDFNYPSKGKANELIYSSYYGYSFFNIYKNNLHGMYPALKKCLDELQYRTKEFEHNTGIAVLASTCEQATSDIEQSYVVRIDTVGIPEIRLLSTEELSKNYSESPFNKAIEKIIQANNGHIVEHTGGHFYFYSNKLIRPQHMDFGDMREGDCQQQLNDLNHMLRNLNQNELTVGCTYIHQQSGYATLRAVWNQFNSFDSFSAEEHYADFNECDRDKSRMLARKNAEGSKVQYALCRLKGSIEDNNGYYLMDLYY